MCLKPVCSACVSRVCERSVLFLPQCSLTCGGGVKSRSVKCVLEPQNLCDPVTRPRSTSFCNLQSCSRTRPQPPPPTPGHDPNDLTSNPTPYTPTVSTSHTPTPSVLHKDDQDFILVNNSSVERDTPMGEDEDEGEEGSTDLQQPPDGSPYTPGYDYITEDERQDNMFTIHTPINTKHAPHTRIHPDDTTTTHTLQKTTTKPARTRTITHTLMTTAIPLTINSPTHTVTQREIPKHSHTHNQKILKVQTRTHSPTQTHSVIKKNTHPPRNPSRTKLTKTGSGKNSVAFWVVGNWSEVKMF